MKVPLTRQDTERLNGDLTTPIKIDFHPGLWFVMAVPVMDIRASTVWPTECKPADLEAATHCGEPIFVPPL